MAIKQTQAIAKEQPHRALTGGYRKEEVTIATILFQTVL